jgi:hypothetical protein
MRILLCAVVLVSTACAAASDRVAATPAAPPPPESAAVVWAAPVAPTVEPSASPAPATAVRLPESTVTVSSAAFPVVRSMVLRTAPLDEPATDAARAGVERYLAGLDAFRDGGFDASQLGITGRFRDVVAAALRASATPGIKRAFVLGSLRMQRHLVKPWGTHAITDVSATIIDRAVDGSAADQVETGTLRLKGDRRLVVSDGWDAAAGRWFNGAAPIDAERIRQQVVDPLGFYLRLESWVPGSTPEGWREGDEATAFWTARRSIVTALDHTGIASRVFDGVIATVERFETFADVDSGLATVRLTGTIVATAPSGEVRRASFERHLRVFLFGSWMPEVVDEQTADGGWLSGGKLALEKIDIDRA